MQILRNPPIITHEALWPVKLLELQSAERKFSRSEVQSVIEFANRGGSILLVIDEECRTPLFDDGVNGILAHFGMTYTEDTEYLHNCGAIARRGVINREDREIPYSGGRAVKGGTAFSWRLDHSGKIAEAHAAYEVTEHGGRIVAMAEAMAYLLMGTEQGVRLTGVDRDPSQTTYWGKDSAIFMTEVRAWLLER